MVIFNDTPILSDLKVDRGTPVGVSPDESGRGRQHTKIANTPDEQIPVLTNLFAPPIDADFIYDQKVNNVQTIIFKKGGSSGVVLKTIRITYLENCRKTYEVF